MGVIDADMRSIVDSAKLGFVATVCADGSPNLSPKGTIRVYDDDHLVFLNQASPGTVANLRRDPRLEVNVVDFLKRRGYRFKGTAQFHAPGSDVFEWIHDWLVATQGPGYPAIEALLVMVERALPVNSPAYEWGHATEAALQASWAKTYGVQVAGPGTDAGAAGA
ncbi:pyridoxamine 5'-phosphate oxidase family protein [Intrasporangium sp.]|uniref:pyridoxamine 5'-phosphate oxidase family protein n=1 Tax=Intrasporangium sp. TaxID=1925024 RepID=UPI0032221259